MSHFALIIGGKPAATTKTFNVLNPADDGLVGRIRSGLPSCWRSPI